MIYRRLTDSGKAAGKVVTTPNPPNQDATSKEMQAWLGKIDAIGRPAIDDATMMKMEKAACSEARGQQRRLCLVALARGLDDLEKLSIKEPKAFGDMLAMTEIFLEHAKGLVEVAEKAVFRLNLADSRKQKAA